MLNQRYYDRLMELQWELNGGWIGAMVHLFLWLIKWCIIALIFWGIYKVCDDFYFKGE